MGIVFRKRHRHFVLGSPERVRRVFGRRQGFGEHRLGLTRGYYLALTEMALGSSSQNQMQEALMLFDSICNSQWFTKTSIVSRTSLVDKSGLLADKILEICFLRLTDLVPEQGRHFPSKDYES